jgi:protein ImuB
MTAFTGEDAPGDAANGNEADRLYGSAFRRFRVPVVAEVTVENGRPARIHTTRFSVGGGVIICAGPWRTSGEWWGASAWDHDEWDVELTTGTICRVFRDRRKDRWFVEGVYD